MTACPRCQSPIVIKAGTETMVRKGPVQRLHCKACGYTWREKLPQKKIIGVE